MRHVRKAHPHELDEEKTFLSLVKEDIAGSIYICPKCGFKFDSDMFLELHTNSCKKSVTYSNIATSHND